MQKGCKPKFMPTPEMLLTTYETQVAVYLFQEDHDPEYVNLLWVTIITSFKQLIHFI